MRLSVYNKNGWVLGRCTECGTLNYVEPHGNTALCYSRAHVTADQTSAWTEHESIPYSQRTPDGCYVFTDGNFRQRKGALYNS